jgi:glycerate 2-kinase
MAQSMPVLVAPAGFGGALRAPVVAAAIARGLERAGCPPPDLCPVAAGGRGTIEVLLPALGGATADGFALVEDGGTAIVELDERAPEAAGEQLAAAAAAGPAVVMLAAAGAARERPCAALLRALDDHGGLRGAALVVLCDVLAPGALALRLRDERGGRLVAGIPFVLETLGFDARMRAAKAVVAGEPRLDRSTLRGHVVGDIATRARQSGVPCHAVTSHAAIDRFDARILDLQAIVEATTVEELEAAGEALAGYV